MAYTKTNWVNGGPPALSAENLNKMEEGIYNNDQLLSAIKDYISDESSIDGWTCRKWNNRTMTAEKDISVGSSWSQVASSGIYYANAVITPPTGMTVTGGYANPLTTSYYLIGAQIQIGTSTILQVHRLASSSTSFNYHVTIVGTY